MPGRCRWRELLKKDLGHVAKELLAVHSLGLRFAEFSLCKVLKLAQKFLGLLAECLAFVNSAGPELRNDPEIPILGMPRASA